MNLGIIAASIATIRPLFANLGTMVRISSDNTGGPYSSNQPLVRNPKASKAGRNQTGILLSPMGTTKMADAEISQDFREAWQERR